MLGGITELIKKGVLIMQYILDEDEVKCLLLCRKYIEELCNNMIKSINANPKLKDNKEFMENYNKYRSAIAVSHPFIQ